MIPFSTLTNAPRVAWSWCSAHAEWITIFGVMVATLQASINQHRRPTWLAARFTSAGIFVPAYLAGIVIIAMTGLLGILCGVSIGNWTSGFVVGLFIGMLINVLLML